MSENSEGAERETAIGLQCAAVADAVFPNYMDIDRRSKFALALVELTRLLREAPIPHPDPARDQ